LPIYARFSPVRSSKREHEHGLWDGGSVRFEPVDEAKSWTRDSHGLWDGGNVRFEPAERAKSWWDDIQGIAQKPDLAPLLPAYCFARTIIAHPYPDGNGRLARALVHAALARTREYRAPCLPLAPAFYMNGTKVAAALRALSDSGDWGGVQFGVLARDRGCAEAGADGGTVTGVNPVTSVGHG
jgi:hypothetical protein